MKRKLEQASQLYLYYNPDTGQSICYSKNETPDPDFLFQRRVTTEEDMEVCLAQHALLENIGHCDKVNYPVDLTHITYIADYRPKIRDWSVILGRDNVNMPVLEKLIISDKIPQQEFFFEKQIAQGGFGVIFQYKDKLTSKSIILKIIMVKADKRGNFDDDNDVKMSELLPEIDCEVIPAKHIGNLTVNNRVFQYVVMPRMNGSLDDLMKDILPLDPLSKFQLIDTLLDRLLCLKEHNLYYTDIKPGNIMYRCAGSSKINILLGDIGSIIPVTEYPTMTFNPPYVFYSKSEAKESGVKDAKNLIFYKEVFASGDEDEIAKLYEHITAWGTLMTIAALFLRDMNRVYDTRDPVFSIDESSIFQNVKNNIKQAINAKVSNPRYKELRKWTKQAEQSIEWKNIAFIINEFITPEADGKFHYVSLLELDDLVKERIQYLKGESDIEPIVEWL